MGKHESMMGLDHQGKERAWGYDETLFWNVYYIKGSFLDSDKAYEVITGMHTLELRMLRKAVNTLTLAEFLGAHPDINVKCNAVPGNENAELRERCLYLGLPAPLFTFDFEGKTGRNGKALFDRATFQRFFDILDPVFGHQVSLGQPNTVVLCPAITSHSEMSGAALKAAGISLTTTRVAVGLEDPRTLIAHLVKAAEATLDGAVKGFSKKFPSAAHADAVYRRHFADVYKRFVEAQPKTAELMA
jgi:O-acetylhomoserine/O-acetylserine sulfhydrylase-like pyridoxal-dependent enzyme